MAAGSGADLKHPYWVMGSVDVVGPVLVTEMQLHGATLLARLVMLVKLVKRGLCGTREERSVLV